MSMLPADTQRHLSAETPQPSTKRKPDGYAYWYDGFLGGLRFDTHGDSVNGCRPAYAVPYYLGAPPPVAEPTPIDMVLHCPVCGMQHIDEPSDDAYDGNPPTWTNPPHRSHLCRACGHVWRPADVPTNGVKTTKTRGKNDSPIAAPGVMVTLPIDVPRGALTAIRNDPRTKPAPDEVHRMLGWFLEAWDVLLEHRGVKR